MRSFLRFSLLFGASLGCLGLVKASDAYAKDTQFSPQQRAEIVQIMRNALKEDPSILTEAVQSLRVKAQEQQHAQTEGNILKNWNILSNGPAYTIRGNAVGHWTIIEFLDPRCGYCRHMAPIIEDFLKRHPDVRLVEKIVPVLGTASVNATRAIFAAGLQGHYSSMRDALLSDSEQPTAARLEVLVKEQGLDRDRFFKDLDSDAVSTMIKNHRMQAQEIGLDGTPTFLFGQHIEVPGALEPAEMDRLLESEKKHS